MALIEAAIALPFLVLLLVGTVEAGFAWRDANTLARATHQAGRTAGRLADSEVADFETLQALQSSLAGTSASTLRRVIVYDASVAASEGAADEPPASCRAVTPSASGPAGVPGVCNVYSAAQVAADDASRFGNSSGCAGDWDQNYCPTTGRDRTGENPDRVGVWVELDFDQVTSVLPGDLSLTRAAVYQLEPCVAGASTC